MVQFATAHKVLTMVLSRKVVSGCSGPDRGSRSTKTGCRWGSSRTSANASGWTGSPAPPGQGDGGVRATLELRATWCRPGIGASSLPIRPGPLLPASFTAAVVVGQADERLLDACSASGPPCQKLAAKAANSLDRDLGGGTRRSSGPCPWHPHLLACGPRWARAAWAQESAGGLFGVVQAGD